MSKVDGYEVLIAVKVPEGFDDPEDIFVSLLNIDTGESEVLSSRIITAPQEVEPGGLWKIEEKDDLATVYDSNYVEIVTTFKSTARRLVEAHNATVETEQPAECEPDQRPFYYHGKQGFIVSENLNASEAKQVSEYMNFLNSKIQQLSAAHHSASQPIAFEEWAKKHVAEHPEDWPINDGQGDEGRFARLAWDGAIASLAATHDERREE